MNDSIKRVKEVIGVLHRNGLGGVIAGFGFARFLPFFSRSSEKLPVDLPKRIRKSMEELGGAYVKLGQLLSLRHDLVPQNFCDEFAGLLDNVPPEQLASIIEVISAEFNRPASDIFSHIDDVPLGSASVAQVHKARLRGKAVAVKVQRHDLGKKFSSDIAIMRFMAHKLQKYSTLNLSAIIDEFEDYTKKELDFTIEASHIEEIGRVTSGAVIIPKVFWAETTKKVLTMEFLDGVKLSDVKTANMPKTVKLLIDVFIDQIFKYGTFHADLHPGNILLLKNNRVGLLDFGIVGHLDKKTREFGLKLYVALLERDSREIAGILLSYGIPSSSTDVNAFVAAVRGLVDSWWDAHGNKIIRLMYELFVLCAKHNIILPKDTVLLGKGMLTLESTALLLDKNFDFVSCSKNKIKSILREEKTPSKVISRFVSRSKVFADAVSILPSRIVDAVESIEKTGVGINLKDAQFRHIGQDINLSSNRLSYSMVSAALILSASVIINTGPKLAGYGVISIVALLVAAFFAFALLISVLREHTAVHDPHA